MPRYVIYPLIVLLLGCLALFAWLHLHNQSQTEYLIFFDFWRNFAALKEGNDLYPFFYHGMHTYAVASAIWYLDVVLVSGTLKFVHGYVLALTLAALTCLALLTRRLYHRDSAGGGHVVFAVLLIAAMWFSPSNADSFAYPLVDILGATLLLLIGLTVALRAGEEIGGQARAMNVHVAGLGYVGIVSLGFLTLETFLVVPLAFAFEALVRGRKRDSFFHLALVAFWFALYVGLLRGPQVPPQVASLDVTAIAHNALVLLSSHYGVLLQALGFEQQTGGRISLCLSLLGLVAFVVLAWRHYGGSTRWNPWFRLPMLLAVLGLAVIVLAVGLRSGATFIYEPVPRYTPYTLMFSFAVLLLGIDVIKRGSAPLYLGLGSAIVALNLAYVLGEAAAMGLLAHNGGARYSNARLEMPVYATSPGYERNLGPVEPDEGLAWRGGLHPFLKGQGLSVFASPGYRSLGEVLPLPGEAEASTCRRVADADASRAGVAYRHIRFEGVDGDGFFFVVDEQGRIAHFSFAAQVTPMDRAVTALFPEPFAAAPVIYFARVTKGRPTAVIACKQ